MENPREVLDYMQGEKRSIIRQIEKSLKPLKLELTDLKLTDDGYEISVGLTDEKENQKQQFKKICIAVDKLQFDEFEVVDTCFSLSKAHLRLAPTTVNSMNQFVCNYILKYFYNYDEMEALAIAIGVLERMIEPLSSDVKNTLEKYTKEMIQ